MITEIDQALTLSLNGSHSLFLDGVAVTATATLTWMPALVALLYAIIRAGEMREIILTILAIGLCVLLADQVASGIFKPLVARPRPAGDPLLMYTIDVVNDYRGGRYGFFSSHAANTMAVATFVSLLMRRKVLTIGLISWSLVNCWTRVYLGVHYVGDLLVGIIWGVIVGFIVHAIFRRFVPIRERGLTYSETVQTSTGYTIAGTNVVLNTLLATYIYCCFRGVIFG